MMKKSGFEKMVMLQKNNKNKGSYDDEKPRSKRFLVNINIMGSAGPIRFVVNEKELVSGVIDTALKSYAGEGRLPVLGFDATNFLLYCANAGFDGMLLYPFEIAQNLIQFKCFWYHMLIKIVLLRVIKLTLR